MASQGYRDKAAGSAPSKAAGILFGMGLGGFIDGIVLHQILQWHHMVSATSEHPTSTVAGLEVNTLVDGFFHLAMWVLVLAASVITIRSWRRGRLAPNWKFHFGLVLAGWGVFNVVEGTLNHHILEIHHVRDDLGGPLLWDLGFLAISVVLTAAGWLLHRQGLAALAPGLNAESQSDRASAD